MAAGAIRHAGLCAKADFDGQGNVANRYLYGPAVDMIMARLGSRLRLRDGESTARLGAEGDIAWYLGDHLGTVRDLADTSGQVIDHVAYDSFGGILSESNPAVGDRFKFTAREFDAAIEQYYYRARYYDARIGRFTSEDPLGLAAGDANVFRYVLNRPTVATDPTGLWHDTWHYEVTLQLAMMAGIGGDVARQIARAAAQPDRDEREAIGALRDYLASRFSFDQRWQRQCEWRLEQARKFHFPADPRTGEVFAGGAVATKMVDDAIAAGDIQQFGEALHAFQDSYSHQGKPFILGVGHARGAMIVRGYIMLYLRRIPVLAMIPRILPPHLQLPVVAGVVYEQLFVPPHWEDMWPEEAAFSPSADDDAIWQGTARQAVIDTYQNLLEFRNRWPQLCNISGPAKAPGEVINWAKAAWPWNDKDERWLRR